MCVCVFVRADVGTSPELGGEEKEERGVYIKNEGFASTSIRNQ